MSIVLKYVILAVAAYLLGSFNAAIILSRVLYKKDVRTQGSGNAGATNAARVFGLKLGLLTFVGDFVKMVAAMLVGRALCGTVGMAAAGAVGLVGHCFPVYFGFRGGKGVSAGAAIALMISWKVLVVVVAFFIALALTTKTASAGSLASAVTLPISAAVFGAELPLLLLAVFTGLTVVFMHRGNIKRLATGTEGKFKLGKSK